MLRDEDIPPKEERKCIRVNKDKNGNKYFQLCVRPHGETESMYIKSSQDIEYLRKLRDYIIEHEYTKQEIINNKYKWKKPAKEPVIEKHIRRTRNGKYGVTKGKSYGVYATLEEARSIRDKLIQCDWDEEQVPEIRVTRRNRFGEDRYIFEERGKYVIKRLKRNEDGTTTVTRYESSIPTIEEARKLRDEWESIDWDWNNLDLL